MNPGLPATSAPARTMILELRRRKPSLDPGRRRRVLTGYGRDDRIPAEWVVELAAGEDGRARFRHVPEGGGEGVVSAGAVRADRLRAAVQTVLCQYGAGTGLTRREVWELLPVEERRNEKVFREVLEDGVGKDWAKQERVSALGGPLYRPGGEG